MQPNCDAMGANLSPLPRLATGAEILNINIALIAMEARKETPFDCTTPRNSGGAQSELSTWPCAR